MNKNEGIGFLGDRFEEGFKKSWFNHFETAGKQFGGFGLDTFVLLEERPDIRILVEATLSHLFDRHIILEWNSGNLVPKATLGESGVNYRIDHDECHGIKELMVLLTHLHNDQHPYLIIDEPELNLHPQFQSFFMQEARKVAGKPIPGTRKDGYLRFHLSLFSWRKPRSYPTRRILRRRGGLVLLPCSGSSLNPPSETAPRAPAEAYC